MLLMRTFVSQTFLHNQLRPAFSFIAATLYLCAAPNVHCYRTLDCNRGWTCTVKAPLTMVGFQSAVRDSAPSGTVRRRHHIDWLDECPSSHCRDADPGGCPGVVAELHALPLSCIQHHEATALSKSSNLLIVHFGMSRSYCAIGQVQR